MVLPANKPLLPPLRHGTTLHNLASLDTGTLYAVYPVRRVYYTSLGTSRFTAYRLI